MATGKDIKSALKTIGANTVFWGWKSNSRKSKNDDKVKGINFWVADGILTFEGADGTTADVTIGHDFQVCGFLDKTSLALLRMIDNDTCVDVSIENGYIVFCECYTRMTLNNRFKLYEPLANGCQLIELL